MQAGKWFSWYHCTSDKVSKLDSVVPTTQPLHLHMQTWYQVGRKQVFFKMCVRRWSVQWKDYMNNLSFHDDVPSKAEVLGMFLRLFTAFLDNVVKM